MSDTPLNPQSPTPHEPVFQRAPAVEPARTDQEPALRPRQSPLLPSEGLRMSMREEGLLDAAGVLQGGKPPIATYGLSDGSLALFLAVAGAMPEGLARARVPKPLAAELASHLIALEIQELVEWQRDARGRQTHLVLTWKGMETFEAARPHRRNSMAARRRAQLR